jgi:hypothetical protein
MNRTTLAFFERYLEQHPGTREVANVLYDVVTKVEKADAIDAICSLLHAYGARVINLHESK